MATLFDSEAGLIAIAAELRKLATSTYAMKILGALIQRPRSERELKDLAISRKMLKKWIAELSEADIITPRYLNIMRRRKSDGSFRVRGRSKWYFLTDPFMADAFQEAAGFVARRLRVKAREASAFEADLDAFREISWSRTGKPRIRAPKKAE